MKKYEGYISIRGILMVKTVPIGMDSIVDKESPFVKKYLGEIRMQSLNQARRYFEQKNGGKKYENI